MTTRLLPRDEWDRLTDTDLGQLRHLLPASSTVIVVEDGGGAVLGCCALVPLIHAEGLWIHPDHRGRAAVARHLWPSVHRVAAATGIQAVLTTMTTETQRLFEHVGAVALPGIAVAIPLALTRRI